MDRNFIESLKILENIETSTHSGSYELVEQAVSRLGNVEPDKIDVSDLVMLFEFGNLNHGKGARDKKILASNLNEDDKRHMLELNTQISKGDYTNSGYEDNHKSNGNCGLFSRAYRKLHINASKSTAQSFIDMLITISKLDDTSQIYKIAEYCLSRNLNGMQAAVVSQIMHLLKPNIFPILNSVGQAGYKDRLGLPLVKEREVGHYIQNAQIISNFRDKELPNLNFRTIDVAMWKIPETQKLSPVAYWLGGSGTVGERTEKFIVDGVFGVHFNQEDMTHLLGNHQGLKEHISNISDSAARTAFELFLQMKSGDKIALKSSFAKGKDSLLRIKAIGTILNDMENDCVYDSELGHTIPVDWQPVEPYVDYELGAYRSTVHQVTKQADIDAIFYSAKQNLENAFREDFPLQPSQRGENFTSAAVSGYSKVLREDVGVLEGSVAYLPSKKSKAAFLRWFEPLVAALKALGGSATPSEVRKHIISNLNLSDETINEIRGKTEHKKFDNEVAWARNYLAYEGFIDKKIRGIWTLTEKGRNAVMTHELASEIFLKWVKILKEHRESSLDGDVSDLEIDYEQAALVNIESIDEYSRGDFLGEVYLSSEKYDDILALLKRKKNIILQGAPGVGKSYMAKRLAYSIIEAKDASKIEMIQFHQSYSYEDFIEGFRPNIKKDGKFDLVDGVFKKFCKIAAYDLDNDYFFIIDEINRGNLSKIMGELMLLLENDKRGEEFSMKLTYSGERFHVPENVYFIGMMNTADRSLAMIDYALRRRFSFISIEPAFENEKFIADFRTNYPDADKVIAKMRKLNTMIAEELDSGHQIGHSYFCGTTTFSDKDIEGIFKYEIEELLREYFFDNTNKVEEALEVL